MKPHLPIHLQHIVDDICEHGCHRVNKMIETMQSEEVVETLESLNMHERTLVLKELKDIMAVYDKK